MKNDTKYYMDRINQYVNGQYRSYESLMGIAARSTGDGHRVLEDYVRRGSSAVALYYLIS